MNLGNLLNKIISKLTRQTITGYTIASGYTVKYLKAERIGNIVHLSFSAFASAVTSSYVPVIMGLPQAAGEQYTNGSTWGSASDAKTNTAYVGTNGNISIKFSHTSACFFDIIYFVGGVTKLLTTDGMENL